MDHRSLVIFAWTQSALAIVVVIGGGILLALTDVEPTAIVGVIGVVVGYFFGSAVQPAPLHTRNGIGGGGKG